MFYAVDNGMSGSNNSAGGDAESISALGLRMFKEYLWEIGKGDIDLDRKKSESLGCNVRLCKR